MTATTLSISTEQRYQRATAFYTQTGISDTLQRQWEFLKKPAQRDFLMGSILLTAGTVIYCTHKGIEIGKDVAKTLDLKDEKRQVVIICGVFGVITPFFAQSVIH